MGLTRTELAELDSLRSALPNAGAIERFVELLMKFNGLFDTEANHD